MRALIVGAAASGKSEVAEDLVMRLGGPRVYIATMQPWGADGQAKVERHRKLRAGKGFSTIECYGGLEDVTVPEGSTVLLECLGNLCANTLYLPEGGTRPVSEVLEQHVEGVRHLAGQCKNLVVIGNEVGADGFSYPAETQDYVQLMGSLNCRIAQDFDLVAEVFCGQMLVAKGTL